MKTIHVEASRAYDVTVGGGALNLLGETARRAARSRTAMVVSETTVFPLYGAKAAAALEQAGFTVYTHIFPAGEPSKNGAEFLSLVNDLAARRLTRSDLVVALGGGVTGDLTGFAAACYLRGVAYIQIPTTLLAMVDSSVGGKTAIDLPAGKNLCGAFYQPAAVLCDTDLLETLPAEIFRDGCAEVVKYGVLAGRDLFDRLTPESIGAGIVAACINEKRKAVEADEFDNGARQFLNLGHTLGHAVEKESGFALSHGQAVSIGMVLIAKAAAKFGLCAPETAREIAAKLQAFGLPVTTDLAPDAILAAALGDKKRRGDSVTLVVPRAIGDCILQPVAVSELPKWIEAGVEPWT